MADIAAGAVEALFRLRDEMTPGLKNLQKNLEAMEKQFGKGIGDRMFDGAILGAEKFSKALNMNVGGALLGGAAAGIAAVGVAAVGAAASMISYSSNIVDLAGKHRTTTDAVQKFGFAARQSGTDLESLLGASGKLQKNLGDGTAKTVAAVKDLGLSFEQLRNSSPEQSMAAVLKAVSGIENPARQAALGAQLLGKNFRELLLVGPDLDALTKRAEELGLVLSEKDLRAAEALGDALDALGEMFMALVNNIGAAITSNESLHVLIEGLTEVFAVLSEQVGQNRQGMTDFVSSGVMLVAKGLVFLADVVQTGLDVWHGLQLTWQSLVGIAADVAGAVFGVAKAWASLTGDKLGEAVFQAQIDSFAQMKVAALEEADAIVKSNTDKTNAIQAVRAELVKLEANVAAAHGKQREIVGSTKDAKTNFEGLSGTLSKTADEWKKYHEATAAAHGMGPTLEELGTTREMIDAMRILAAAPKPEMIFPKGLIVPSTGEFKKVGEVAALSFKDAFKTGLSTLPGVILGALQGGGDVGKSIGAHLGGSIAGSLSKPLTTGLQNLLGPALGAKLGGMAGTIMGPLGTMLGSAIGGLASKLGGKLLGSIFGGGEGKKVNDMRDQFVAAAGGLDVLGAKAKAAGMDLTALLKADKVKEFEAAVLSLNNAWDTQALAQQKVNEAIDRYGFTIDELGPRMAAQELETKAIGLLQDWNLLNAAGIEQTAIISRMGPAMNEFLNQSIAAGVGIPESMRPALEKMLEMGQLTDAAGNKMTSLEGVTWTQTLSEGLKQAIDGINRLVNALQGIPPRVSTEVNTRFTESRPGGDSTDHNGVDHRPPDFAAAAGFTGWVAKPTTFLAGEDGREHVQITPASEMGRAGSTGSNSPAASTPREPDIIQVFIGGQQFDDVMVRRKEAGYF